MLSIALVAPEGDIDCAIVIGSIRAETRRATLKSYAEIAADHLASLKGVVDFERASYDAFLSDLVAFLAARAVAVDRSLTS